MANSFFCFYFTFQVQIACYSESCLWKVGWVALVLLPTSSWVPKCDAVPACRLIWIHHPVPGPSTCQRPIDATSPCPRPANCCRPGAPVAPPRSRCRPSESRSSPKPAGGAMRGEPGLPITISRGLCAPSFHANFTHSDPSQPSNLVRQKDLGKEQPPSKQPVVGSNPTGGVTRNEAASRAMGAMTNCSRKQFQSDLIRSDHRNPKAPPGALSPGPGTSQLA